MLSRWSVQLVGYLAIAGLGGAGSAMAHMPYVLPSTFDVGQRDRVTIEASFTEDAFRPEIAMRDAPFEIAAPDGTTTRLSAPTIVGDRTLTEAVLTAEGIYRLSSGQRAGRVGRMYRSGSDWVMAGEDGTPPAGARMVDVRSMTLADAYVLRGRAGARGALAPRGRALELHPTIDPTALAPGMPVRFALLYDGKPLDGQHVMLFREGGLYDGRKQVADTVSGTDGSVVLNAPDAGRYLALTRHRAALPDGTYASFTVTVALEIG